MTQVNFRIEDDVKANAEKALKEMGLTMSTAITLKSMQTLFTVQKTSQNLQGELQALRTAVF